MALVKGKVRGSNQFTEDGQTRQSVGGRSFKVFSENAKVKVDTKSIRKSIPVGKGARVALTSTSDLKGSSKVMEKCKVKCESSENTKVQRKALSDVSNIKRNSSRNTVLDATKLTKSRNMGSAILKRVSVGTVSRALNDSSRKSIMGNQRNSSNVHTTNIGIKDIKATLDDRWKKTKNSNYESMTTDSRAAKNLLLPTRKSLPASKRMIPADNSNAEENTIISEKAKQTSGALIDANITKKVLPQMSNARSHLWRYRASDGFIRMAPSAETNKEALYALKKSIKPTVKTTIRASNAQKTSNSKFLSSVKKSASITAISSKKEEVATSSIPENVSTMVSNKAIEGEYSSDGNNDPATNLSKVITRKKSDHRRSYTSLLLARSKFLVGHGEVAKQEKLPNIDDDRNELEVAEYVDEIYQYYWVTEAQNPQLANYMSIQTEIAPHMRGILVNWLIEVHLKFDLMPETLYLTVMLVDRYLSQIQIKRNEMQLVGLTSLLLASKYEDFWHPRVKDLISISAESYTRDQMLAMEKLILKKLKFRLNTPTPYVFLLRFLKAAQSDVKLEHLAFYLIELSLVEYEALKFKPSLLCAAAIYLARCTLQMTPAWTPLLHRHAHYDVTQIRDCAEMILRFQKAAKTGQLRVTYEKYTNSNLSSVATIRPLGSLPH